MSYELDTVVRRPVSSRLFLLAFLAVVVLGYFWNAREVARVALVAAVPFALAVLVRVRVSERALVVASLDGLRVGKRLIARDRFRGAFLSHEDDHTWVALRGRASFDIQVRNNIEADALVSALGLDAASSTVEVRLTRAPSAFAYAVVASTGIAAFIALGALPNATSKAIATASALAAALATLWLATRVSVRIGADGLALARPLRRDRFIPHDAIAFVRCEDDAVVLTLRTREKILLRVPGMPLESDDEREQRASHRADEAQSIVRRIVEAERAFRDHRAAPEALAGVLRRGGRTAREWLDELRRIGEGAAGTFRTMNVARSQLLDVVESTSASARDRIAAIVALRVRLSEDEAPRIRVAAERCAEPDLRQQMIRVVEAEDEELEHLIDEMSASRR